MARASSLLLAAVLAAVSAAQSTTTVTVMMPLVGDQPIFGSVVEVLPTATSYVLACPTDVDSTECVIPAGLSLLSGPSTMSYQLEIGESDTVTAGCTLASETLDCSAGVVAGGTTELTTTQMPVSEVGTDIYHAVTITAGVEKLRAAATSTGGVPRITQNAVIMGAAALVGGAMLV
ncbi:hypothetical protein MMYC01_201528 [Madurella mycetomatis]|uniref:Uncharacterized protein n=1 Tax=Madurella mycetomatis TaxID=100816 RepID=A0A175W5K1_9PEZI|nr:hypothetical protein MMYC01_204031 [Madurella mycetomatis]KXX82100.1 hypothetical protein MMYC01_201528 [Madurella mycetomatis]